MQYANNFVGVNKHVYINENFQKQTTFRCVFFLPNVRPYYRRTMTVIREKSGTVGSDWPADPLSGPPRVQFFEAIYAFSNMYLLDIPLLPEALEGVSGSHGSQLFSSMSPWLETGKDVGDFVSVNVKDGTKPLPGVEFPKILFPPYKLLLYN